PSVRTSSSSYASSALSVAVTTEPRVTRVWSGLTLSASRSSAFSDPLPEQKSVTTASSPASPSTSAYTGDRSAGSVYVVDRAAFAAVEPSMNLRWPAGHPEVMNELLPGQVGTSIVALRRSTVRGSGAGATAEAVDALADGAGAEAAGAVIRVAGAFWLAGCVRTKAPPVAAPAVTTTATALSAARWIPTRL